MTQTLNLSDSEIAHLRTEALRVANSNKMVSYQQGISLQGNKSTIEMLKDAELIFKWLTEGESNHSNK